MSLFPVFLPTDQNRRQPQQSASQQMIIGVTPEGALTLISPTSQSWTQPSLPRKILSTLINTTSQENFELNIDVHHFAPEEISVKTVERFLIIEAGHDEKRDQYGWVKRQFSRRYELPEGVNIDAIESRLSSDGILTVIAPQVAPPPRNERMVPIIQTGPVKGQPEVKTEMGDGETPEVTAAIAAAVLQ